uniref:Uncharacterized protein n=1 Tax=Panagrolaimus sp. ES5 TaxID=591445 RepID=A0AC34G9M1_9BILA
MTFILPGGVGSSSKSKRSTKSAGSTKSGKKTGKASSSKDLKSKRSSKSIDKSGKNSKKSSKSSKGSKSSKSKRSKRDVKLQQTGPPSSQRSDAAKQPASARTAIEAEKRSAKLAATHAGAALNRENSIRSAATQASSSQKSQPPSCTIVDGNGNNIGTTALVAVGA